MYHLVKLPTMGSARDALLSRIIDDVSRSGIGDRSLRDLAAAVGTSHRLLIYHFGSRAGLVAAIVAEIEAQQRAVYRQLAIEITDPAELVRALWRRLSAAEIRPFVRLFFEALTVPVARPDGARLTGEWLDDSAVVSATLGTPYDPVEVRLGIAVVRGLLIDVIATDDTTAADAALERFLTHWPATAPTVPSPGD
jgi:AcrR family transcriptional regulator